MVKRIEAERFDRWWAVKRARWTSGASGLANLLGFARRERMAKVYRSVERRYEKDLRRGTGFRPWHATQLHRQYRLKKRGRA